MRRALLLLCAALAAACDDPRGGAADELTIVVRGDRRELELQEKAIAAREEALRAEKAQLDKRIEELAKNLSAADAEQRRRLDEELAKARALQREVATRFDTLAAQRGEVDAKRSALEPPPSRVEQSALAAREAGVGAREAKVAEREAALDRRAQEAAARERRLADREAEQAGRERALDAREAQVAGLEKLEPGAARAGLERLREVPKAGVVEQSHKKVLDDLTARGVLIADLPVEVQPVNAEIWNARRRGDFARAADLVGELARASRLLKVDQKFVEQKMLRLQGLRAGARVSDAQRQEVERLLREVTAAYSDGRYEVANRGLNRIAAILDAGAAPG